MENLQKLFSLRNVNRPYTQNELNDIYKKDYVIKDENKKSRLGRSVSIDCVNKNVDNKDQQKDDMKIKN